MCAINDDSKQREGLPVKWGERGKKSSVAARRGPPGVGHHNLIVSRPGAVYGTYR